MNTPDNNPKTRAGGMNKVPFHLVPPRALAHVALCFADGGFKYRPYNWHVEKISSSVYYGAILRHIFAWWCGETNAKDGHHHLAHAACCMLMVLDVDGTAFLHDNRPAPIGEDFSDLLDQLADELPTLRARESTKFDLHDIPTREEAEDEECFSAPSTEVLARATPRAGYPPVSKYRATFSFGGDCTYPTCRGDTCECVKRGDAYQKWVDPVRRQQLDSRHNQ